MILVKIFKNRDFCRNLWKILFWLKFWLNFDFGRKLPRNRVFLSKFLTNGEFGRYFRKIPISVEIFETLRFWTKLLKISIWVKFCENVHFGRNVRKCRFWSKFEKSQFWSKFAKNVDFSRNLQKSRFWLKCVKNLAFGRNLPKSQFLLNFAKISS